MTSRISLLFVFLMLSACLYGQRPANISFTIKNAGINVKGHFDQISITQKFDPEDLVNSMFEVSIPSTTIDTGIKGRDRHLRKAKYFDVENHPNITFKSTLVEKAQTGFLLKGELMIKETTKSIEIPFSIEDSQQGKFLKGYIEIDRRDYGVGKNHLIMGNKVKIYIEVPYTE